MPDPYFSKDSAIEGKIDVINAKVDVIDGNVDAVLAILENNKNITAESTYRTAPTQILANTDYHILRIVNDSGTRVVTIYKYNLTHAPGETTDQVAVSTLTDVDGAVTFKILIDINKAVSGLWPLCAGTEKLYFTAYMYDPKDSTYHSLPVTQLRNTASDNLISVPPVETDLGEYIILDDLTVIPGSRLDVRFYSDTAIAQNIDIPYLLSVSGLKE